MPCARRTDDLTSAISNLQSLAFLLDKQDYRHALRHYLFELVPVQSRDCLQTSAFPNASFGQELKTQARLQTGLRQH